MKETAVKPTRDSYVFVVPRKQPEPKGIGMAVALDWGLALQMLIVPILPFFLSGTVGAGVPGQGNTGSQMMLLVSLPAALFFAFLGEGLRRGWRWTRYVQIVLNTLTFLNGFVTAVDVWPAFQRGSYWSITTLVLLLVVSPLIVWRLARRDTGSWFKMITSAEARRRHGGMWPFYIVCWALVGAILQSLAIYFR